MGYSVSCCGLLGLGDGIALRVVAGLVGEVVNSLGLALRVGVGVRAANHDDVVGLILLIEGLLQLAVLVAADAVFSLEAIKIIININIL